MKKRDVVVMHIRGGSQYATFKRTVLSVSKRGQVCIAGLGLNEDKAQMRFYAVPDDQGRMGYSVNLEGVETWFTEYSD